MPSTVSRCIPPTAFETLTSRGIHPVLARVYAARGIEEPGELEVDLSRLIPFERLKNICPMARFLAEAIAGRKRMLIVADYDSDGATACAVGIRGLRKLGAIVDYLVPDRFKYGYGLTPEIVRHAAVTHPDILITVDNGISSLEGVAEARRFGMQVLVTDHHLPGDELPDAALILNPNQPGCGFPSKHLAGVGVIFYLMLALRAELRASGAFRWKKVPNFACLLDLVALGTVADVVKLDKNNRILVHNGLRRIRRGRACAGINALLHIAQRDFHCASAHELGFSLGPRLNAAGRLEDMSLGIECLITDDESRALEIAHQLDTLNRKRREIEASMHHSACTLLENELQARYLTNGTIQPPDSHSLSLFDASWHQGVIGILASRIKDKYHRPVIAFAPGTDDDEIKGSGRSIPGFHLRDALDLISKRHPGLLLKFGGHAAAAGLTLRSGDFKKFQEAFEQTAQALLAPADLRQVIETDGDLDETEINLELAAQLAQQVWGQGFAQPTFSTCFRVEDQRVVGKKHLKLKLSKTFDQAVYRASGERGRLYDAILFSSAIALPEVIRAVYRLHVNEFNSNSTLQLILDHWSPANA